MGACEPVGLVVSHGVGYEISPQNGEVFAVAAVGVFEDERKLP